MEERLKELRAEADDLHAQIQLNRHQQTELMIKMFVAETKLAVGDMVIVDDTKRGIVIDYKRDYGYIKLQVQYYKKDGILGERIESVWQHQIAKVSK